MKLFRFYWTIEVFADRGYSHLWLGLRLPGNILYIADLWRPFFRLKFHWMRSGWRSAAPRDNRFGQAETRSVQRNGFFVEAHDRMGR